MASGNVFGGVQEPPSPPPNGMETPLLDMQKMDMDAWSKGYSTEFGKWMQKMRTIRDEQISQISAILSDEPRAKYQKDTERKMRDQNDGLPDGSPPPPSGGQGGGKPPP